MKKTQKSHTDYVVAVRIPVKWKQEVFHFPNEKAKTEFIQTIKKEYPIVEFIHTINNTKRKVKK